MKINYTHYQLLINRLMLMLLLSFITTTTFAQNKTFTVVADGADVAISNNLSMQWAGYHLHRLGTSKNTCAVIPFKLPELLSGESVVSADFTTTILGANTQLNNGIDLYALPYSTTNTVNTADFYAGEFDNTNSTLIKSSFLNNQSIVGAYKLANSVELIDFINQQYANGAKAGDYVFIRLSFDESNSSNYNYWDIASANSTTEGNKPVLNISVETQNINTAPVLSVIENKNIKVGESKSFIITATDADNDDLTFTANNLPVFATLVDNNNSTATLQLNPVSGNNGTYNNIEISVTDGKLSVNKTFSVSVTEDVVVTNTPPVLLSIGNVTLEEDLTNNILISATDVDNDDLSITANNLPSFATLNDNGNGTANLILSPNNSNIGVYNNIVFTVNDGEFTANETITVEVTKSIVVVVGEGYYCDPINGSNSNDGSFENPFAGFATVNWGNVNLVDGDVINLLNGHHGSAYFANQIFAEGITIKAVNNYEAVFTKFQAVNVKNVTFKGIKFDATGGNFATTSPIFFTDNQSEYITVDNCIMQSAESSVTWTKADWYEHSASGFQFRGDNNTLVNTKIYNIYHGVEFQGINTVMNNNLIDNFCGDAIRALGSYGVYENNLVRDCYVDDYNIQHDDFFQSYKLGGDRMISNIVVRNNTFKIFDDPVTDFVKNNNLIGTLLQGIIITDGFADSWIVENNLVVSNKEHGISLYGARNCRVQNNTVVQSALFTDTNAVPKIMLTIQKKTGEKNFDNIIRNNICGVYTPWTYSSTSLIENNVDIDESNYENYKSYFVDYVGNDFHLKQNSVAIDAGVNTSVLSKDLDGNNRVAGGVVDAGCYEYNSYVVSNTAPVINFIADVFLQEGNETAVNISATDAENNDLHFSISTEAEFVSITDNNNGTAVLNINTIDGDNGNYTVEVVVNDGELTDTKIVNIEVAENGGVSVSDITINASATDNSVFNNGGMQWVGYHTHRIGSDKNISVIIPFEIPELGVGENITSAKFNFTVLQSGGNLNNNIDMYGLPYRNTSTVLSTDYFAGAFGTDNNATALQNNILELLPTAGRYSSSVGVELANYINTEISNGAKTGDFVFIRLSIDTNENGNYNFWDIAAQDDATAQDRPTLQLSTSTASGKKALYQKVNEESTNEMFTMYPNPSANGTFTIQNTNLSRDAKMSIYSILGHLVHQQYLSSEIEHVDAYLSKGIYFVKIVDNNNTSTKRLIVE
ncbi:MAG: T9SS type A sorting domain-containing protein [Ichthyobacteriaceae bacterium]|nr:T9SS type A sorting domain-containing protein [Ichthyobacteriaceae bacterium]